MQRSTVDLPDGKNLNRHAFTRAFRHYVDGAVSGDELLSRDIKATVLEVHGCLLQPVAVLEAWARGAAGIQANDRRNLSSIICELI